MRAAQSVRTGNRDGPPAFPAVISFGGRVILFLPLKGHLKEFVPRLPILRHLSDLEPLALLIQFDGVSHPPTLWNLQSPLHRI